MQSCADPQKINATMMCMYFFTERCVRQRACRRLWLPSSMIHVPVDYELLAPVHGLKVTNASQIPPTIELE